jgi:sporulation protein YlmC with PRC-barrel domain
MEVPTLEGTASTKDAACDQNIADSGTGYVGDVSDVGVLLRDGNTQGSLVDSNEWKFWRVCKYLKQFWKEIMMCLRE